MVDLWVWPAFVGFVLALLLLDLLVFHRHAHEVRLKEAAGWSVVWVALGVAFGAFVWVWQGPVYGGQYMAGYLIEKALSVDNIFVFALIFSYFSVPAKLEHRVLFWGILGALVFRAMFIAAGAAVLHHFHWAIYVFGAFLVFTGIKMARHNSAQIHPERNPVLRQLRRLLPMTSDYRGQHFFVAEAGRRFATPLLAVLVVVETTDIVFAVDSIPAIFAVTREPFIVFTSNAFAILGLRAMFFMLSGVIRKFRYLKVGLSLILVFVGLKMLASDVYHVPIWYSLGAIGAILTASIATSLLIGAREGDAPDGATQPSEAG